MGKTTSMQPPTTVKGPGGGAGTEVPQPSSGWLDTKDFKEAALDVEVLLNDQPVNLKLVLQTAAAPAGPWRDIGTPISTATYSGIVYASTCGGRGAEDLERFVRWQIDPTALGGAARWTICFKICAVLK